MNKATSAYLQTGVNTTSPGQLLIMLYEAAIKFLRQAQERIQAKDVAKKGILISKALDILTELTATLNLEKGGDLADNLQKLYFYCTTKLLQANLKQDVAMIEEVIGILDGLRDAYQSLLNQGVSGQEGRSVQSGTSMVRGFATPSRPAQPNPSVQDAAQVLACSAKPGQPPMPRASAPGVQPRPQGFGQPGYAPKPAAPVQQAAPRPSTFTPPQAAQAPRPASFGAPQAPQAPSAPMGAMTTALLTEGDNQPQPVAPAGAAPSLGGLGRAFSSYAKSAKSPPRT